ncbi:MAG: hypothetical protein A3K19_03760 [Lentisphaerae bacterium RIFOXYB12_FULL_65_16]|nr:MAG: hypothetical protein A3K18_03105 [Lentisphaerae bacterium RIFOXYA12_64_32]OGV89260.1 MAG: hypothetical protein A3K19_03760 [Lentisphaerae bacterium RIFOXYB12_FULL_65_16]
MGPRTSKADLCCARLRDAGKAADQACLFGRYPPKLPSYSCADPYPGCRLDEGRYNYNYPQLLTELHRRQYRGFISVEDFDGTRTPEQRLQNAVTYLRRIEPKA